MGFDASNAVAALDWDFTAFGAGQGTSPEPSDEMIERYKRKQMRLATAVVEQVALTQKQIEADDKEVQIVNTLPLKEALSAIASLDGDSELNTLAIRQLAQIVAEVLSDKPTADQILALPSRVRAAFFGWVAGQLLDPKSYASGMRPTPRALNVV